MHFQVYGEYRVPITPKRRIDREAVDDFWATVDGEAPGLSDAMGCYVFGIKSSGGTTMRPWYVGKTVKGFRRECFQHHKIINYNDALEAYDRGRANLFLLPKCTRSGKFSNTSSSRVIDFLEKYLIGIALGNNPDLLNIRDTKMYRDLYVPGLVNAAQGNPGTSAKKLKRALRV